MRPFDPGRMRAWPVGSRVGAVANQGEDLMAEVSPTVNSAWERWSNGPPPHRTSGTTRLAPDRTTNGRLLLASMRRLCLSPV